MNETPSFCGFLNVLKPPGMTSAHVVSIVRRLFHGEKVGHAGTLDPEAAGVLPLMIGKAARLFEDLQDKQKEYVTEAAFGCATDTEDAQGKAIAEGTAFPDEAAVRNALQAFRGDILQVPPAFSALKQEGQRLYDLARAGKTVELPPRPVTVYGLELLRMMPANGVLLKVQCSKGFYVRSLCRDLGRAVGCPAHMRFLLRVRSGTFSLDNAHTLEELFEAGREGRLADLLLTPAQVLPHIPVYHVPDRMRVPVANGGRIPWSAFAAQGETESGVPMALEMDGAWCAIALRSGNAVKVRTWLGG